MSHLHSRAASFATFNEEESVNASRFGTSSAANASSPGLAVWPLQSG